MLAYPQIVPFIAWDAVDFAPVRPRPVHQRRGIFRRIPHGLIVGAQKASREAEIMENLGEVVPAGILAEGVAFDVHAGMLFDGLQAVGKLANSGLLGKKGGDGL